MCKCHSGKGANHCDEGISVLSRVGKEYGEGVKLTGGSDVREATGVIALAAKSVVLCHRSGFTADWLLGVRLWEAHRRCMKAKAGLTGRIGPVTSLAVLQNQVSGAICSLTVLQTFLLQEGVFVENPVDPERRGWRDGAVVSSHTYQSARTLCAFEARLWNPDVWACAVVCGEAWISPMQLWLLTNEQDRSWTPCT